MSEIATKSMSGPVGEVSSAGGWNPLAVARLLSSLEPAVVTLSARWRARGTLLYIACKLRS
jgi:hypothetical protein